MLKRTFEAGTFTREMREPDLSEKVCVTLIMKAVVAVPDKVKVEWLVKTKSVSLSTTLSLAPPVIVSELPLRLTLVRSAYRGVTGSIQAASERL
jgi:hypothetical protein